MKITQTVTIQIKDLEFTLTMDEVAKLQAKLKEIYPMAGITCPSKVWPEPAGVFYEETE